MKNRVKSVLNYKKPAFWIILIAIVASIAVAVCSLTNLVSTLSYRIINPLKTKQKYEDIANYAGAEKLTWTYNPMLSHTGHYTKAFFLDFDYTYVEATCTEGEFWSLDVEGQPRGIEMRFENGKTVYWAPTETEIAKVPQISEVTLAIYNDETQLHKCTVVFECVSRDTASAEFEIYLKVADGLRMVSSGDGIKLIKQSSISNIGGADDPVNMVVSVDMEQFKSKMPELFWTEIPIAENNKYSPIIDTATFDIDGDGKNEQCSLSYGPTSGLFTFVLSVSENGRLEYYNIYNGLAGEMSFETTTDGNKLHLVPQGESTPIDYSFSVKDGNIVLTANGESVAYWGEQGINSKYTP